MTMNRLEQSFLGRGWRFPLMVNGRGSLAQSQLEHGIEESMGIILRTAKGERVMRPEFGSSMHELVFAPNNASTVGLAAHYVEEALARWEPRIDVNDVIVEPDPMDDARMLIDVSYTIKATNDDRNLVFPFYLIPREE